jgi:hypothetical protein
VVFEPVPLAEYETLSAKSAAGEFRLEPEQQPA